MTGEFPNYYLKIWLCSAQEHFPGIDLNTNCLDYENKIYKKIWQEDNEVENIRLLDH